MKIKYFALLFFALLLSTPSFAQDWPQWRGENQDDKSTAENLLQSWPEEGPDQTWLFESAGLGYAGFSIVGDKLFTMGLEDNTDFALCLDANTGKELWRTNISERYNNGWGDGPRSTPTVDGDHVYFMAAKGDLVCLSLDGDKVWSVSMTDFGGAIPSWGYSESPLVDGDLVLCTPGGEQGSILALNKLTGKKVWQSVQLTTTAHYSSIVSSDGESGKQYVQLLLDKIVAVSPKDGTVIWESAWPGTVAVIPSPIVDNGKVYVTSGYGVGSKLIDVSSGTPNEVYYNKVMVNHHGGVVLHDGAVYGYSDRKGFVCQDYATGKMLWNEKDQIKKGAVTFADNRFYFVEEQSGDVILIEPSTKKWIQQGRFTLSPQTERRKPRGRIWVHPVVANGKLYLRDQQYIHCYDISTK